MTAPVDLAYLTRWAKRLELAAEDPRYTVTAEVAQMMRDDAAQLRRAIAALHPATSTEP